MDAARAQQHPYPSDGHIGALSDKKILEYIQQGEIVIEPFAKENLQTCSYDVSLGNFYYRQTKPITHGTVFTYNPYDKECVDALWQGPFEACDAGCTIMIDQIPTRGHFLKGIAPTDKIIWLEPRETILAHTQEFIGGKARTTAKMYSRSSSGRNLLGVCKCAGWGDVGYFNRWTMEITNFSDYMIPLIVGRRYAQIVFYPTGPTEMVTYNSGGKYQDSVSLSFLMSTWKPSAMLPKMYDDREAKKAEQERLDFWSRAETPDPTTFAKLYPWADKTQWNYAI